MLLGLCSTAGPPVTFNPTLRFDIGEIALLTVRQESDGAH